MAIGADAAALERAAVRLERVGDELAETLRRLQEQLAGLGEQWQGAGAGSFARVSEGWLGQQAELRRALAETAADLRAAATGYAVADQDAGARLAREPAGETGR